MATIAQRRNERPTARLPTKPHPAVLNTVSVESFNHCPYDQAKAISDIANAAVKVLKVLTCCMIRSTK